MGQPKIQARWLLIVYDGRSADVMLHRLGLRPSKSKAGEYIGFYALDAKSQLLNHIDRLKAVGLRGIARRVAIKSKPKVRSHKRKKAAPQQPDAQIVSIQAAAMVRLAADREKLAAEKRSQAAQRKRADTDQQARLAVLRAKGEM